MVQMIKKDLDLSSSQTAGDVFVHYSVIIDDGRRTLVEGQKVIMEITQTEKGPQSGNVSPANSD